MTINELPPKDRTIIPPEEGWGDMRYYVVETAFTRNNPIHRAIFCSGFITRKELGPDGGGYQYILSNSLEDGATELRRIHYMKVICEIKEMRRDL